MSHTILDNLLKKGDISSLSYSYSRFEDNWVTMCKITKNGQTYCDVSISEEKRESEEKAAERAYNLYQKKCKAAAFLQVATKNYKKYQEEIVAEKEGREKKRCTGDPERCRCLSFYGAFYGMDKNAVISVVIHLCEKYGPVDWADYYHWESKDRYIMVVMKHHRDADDVFRAYGNRGVLSLTVVKGHPKQEAEEQEREDPYKGVDTFVMPPRKTPKKKLTKKELDEQLEEYMRGCDEDGMDGKIDEYLKTRPGGATSGDMFRSTNTDACPLGTDEVGFKIEVCFDEKEEK